MQEIFNDVPNIACLTLKNFKATLENFQYSLNLNQSKSTDYQ